MLETWTWPTTATNPSLSNRKSVVGQRRMIHEDNNNTDTSPAQHVLLFIFFSPMNFFQTYYYDNDGSSRARFLWYLQYLVTGNYKAWLHWNIASNQMHIGILFGRPVNCTLRNQIDLRFHWMITIDCYARLPIFMCKNLTSGRLQLVSN